MFIKLLGILFTAFAALAVAVFLAVVLLLMARFAIVAVIVVLFLGVLYALVRATGLHIDFY